MRVAAVGDIHIGADSDRTTGRPWAHVGDDADVLLLAGDLTKCGTADEAHRVAEQFADVTVPVVAVLGNHDHHADEARRVVEVLTGAGIVVLEGTATTLDLPVVNATEVPGADEPNDEPERL